MVATMPEPLKIHFADEDLRDLKARLARPRWPDQPAAASGWRQGTDLSYIRELAAHWRDRYDWRRREQALNGLPNYSASLDGIDLHFIHQPGVGRSPLPLLLLHGWPSSFIEFERVLPLLTDPARFGADPDDSFSVVVPSLPGYGLSFRPNQPRFDIAQIAATLTKLMRETLGYRRFGAHGGDWGAHIATRLGQAHSQALLGIHLTMLVLPRPRVVESDEERLYVDTVTRWNREDSGYAVIQGTRPQTLAYGLTDSPVGLAAWLVEKFREWSDCDGDIERRFDKDTLLDTITLYWLTGCINSSFGLYHSIRHGGLKPSEQTRVEVPTGYTRFPEGALHPPRSLAERAYNIQHWSDMPAGGHFPAIEEPAALAQEIREFFRPLRSLK
ncbi:epoxide hydrolase family protein [Steroidobacter flavus]|uniref:Epoxide hydrolase family protein n=1 Tax=Steroidobacter flavus TaxID=1842136 RepID=A0ABV8T078_9GAMM